MKLSISILLILLIAIVIQGCSQPLAQPDEQHTNTLPGSWESIGIQANGYYSENMKLVLTFNEDLSCVEDSYFVSSGNLNQSVDCNYKIDNNEIRVYFPDQMSIKSVLNGKELTLAHQRGRIYGNPLVFTRVK